MNRKWARFYRKKSDKSGSKSKLNKNGKTNESKEKEKKRKERINDIFNSNFSTDLSITNPPSTSTNNPLSVATTVAGSAVDSSSESSKDAIESRKDAIETCKDTVESSEKADYGDGILIDSSGDSDEKENDSVLDVFVPRQENSRYYSWKLYFEDEDKENPVILERIRICLNFMEKHPRFTEIKKDSTGPCFNLNLNNLLTDEDFAKDWQTFQSELENNPKQTLNCLSLALRETVIKNILEKKLNSKLSLKTITNYIPTLRVKIYNFEPILNCSDIKFNFYGKLVSIRGCVMRVGVTKQLAEWLLFTCTRCQFEKIHKQPDGIYSTPKNCDNCGKSKFHPKLSSHFTKTIPFQTIKLQEQNKIATLEDRGKMPRIIEIELFNDLVETCIPGDDVTIVGIVKIRGTDDGHRKGKDENGPNALYIEAISVVNNKKSVQSKRSICEMKDFYLIKRIHDKPFVLELLVASICPSIFGHHMVKLGLLLSLFGGCYSADTRNDIHLLMVGDPGLGKSQLLQACARVAPHCVFICGSASSTAGLTITLSKEQGTNDFILEPGALVLADNGVCLIDEFDKMPTQHQALLEAMEQQSVSVAKSGIICSLPARTSVLAAANPIGGRYNLGKTVKENLNLSEPLLSRFDLIFLLLDLPNTENDALMCAHVLKFHTANYDDTNGEDENSLKPFQGKQNSVELKTLKQKLEEFKCRNEDSVSQELLRKYISYARTYVHPKLTPEAAEILQDYYLELRKKTNIFGSLPVFHRQLEGLIRLTEARAKMELREKTTVNDANDVVELFNYTLTNIPALGSYRHLKPDGGKLTIKKVKEFIKVLKQEKKRGIVQFSKEELEILAEQSNVLVEEFTRFIYKLNEEGIIIKIGNDLYQFVGE